jgi:hypothetical protein
MYQSISEIIGIETIKSNSQSASFFKAHSYCKYSIDSGSTKSIDIKIFKLFMSENSRLVIYGGIYGNDDVVFDSSVRTVSTKITENTNYKPVYYNGANYTLTAPCGKALIIIESNSSHNDIYNSIHFSYSANSADVGEVCQKYSKIIKLI